jgi:hypothetical protein
MRFSPHLYSSRHKVYYFRFVIPDWLRPIVGRSEIRRSLRTHDPREAIRIAANMSIEVEGLIRDMAQKKTTPAFHDLKYLLLKQGNDSIEVKDLTSDPNSPADQELLRTLTQKIKELGTGEAKIIPSSGMTLPIHGKLIELGLLELLESKKRMGHKRVFEELKKQRDGYSQGVSKWFGRFLRQAGILDRKKVFHSFRHTVATVLRDREVPQEKIGAILGHSDESNVTARYAKRFSVESLRAEIEKLDFDLPYQISPHPLCPSMTSGTNPDSLRASPARTTP